MAGKEPHHLVARGASDPGWASPSHTPLFREVNVIVNTLESTENLGDLFMSQPINQSVDLQYVRWNFLLHNILEYILKEMIYRLGYFSELSVAALDSLFRSCLIQKCAILYSSYCIWLPFQDNDKVHIALDSAKSYSKRGGAESITTWEYIFSLIHKL